MKRCRSGVMVNPPRVGKRKRPGRNPERTWRNRRGGVKDGSANVINSPNAVNGQVRLAGKSTREGSAEESPRPPRSGLVQHVIGKRDVLCAEGSASGLHSSQTVAEVPGVGYQP